MLPPLPSFKLRRERFRFWAVAGGLGAAAAQFWLGAVLTILDPPLLGTLAVFMENADRGGQLGDISREI